MVFRMENKMKTIGILSKHSAAHVELAQTRSAFSNINKKNILISLCKGAS